MSTKPSKDRASLCAFAYSDGRQCRMPRHSRQSKYCLPHDRKLRHLREAEETASNLSEPLSGDFVPATALTHSLTRLFRALAEGRISPKCATALSRVAGTLLKSINESSREFQTCYRSRYWNQLIYDHYTDLPDYIPPEPRNATPEPSVDSDSQESEEQS